MWKIYASTPPDKKCLFKKTNQGINTPLKQKHNTPKLASRGPFKTFKGYFRGPHPQTNIKTLKTHILNKKLQIWLQLHKTLKAKIFKKPHIKPHFILICLLASMRGVILTPALNNYDNTKFIKTFFKTTFKTL